MRRAWIIFGACTLYGVNSALHTHFQWQLAEKPISWGRAFFAELSFAWIVAAMVPGILWLGRKARLGWPPDWRAVLAHITGLLVFSAAAKLLWDLVYRPPRAFFEGGITFHKLVLSISYVYDSSFLLYTVILAAGYGAEFYSRYKQGEVESERLRAAMIQARLEALETKLQPHFLFNTLHTISALVQEEPLAAERTIARLSEVLRMTLSGQRAQEIPLSQEMHLVELYLEIERTRYEDRLQVSFDVDPAVCDALVPSLILQPLVENAIKHGISKVPRNGALAIRAWREDADLRLSVRNTGSLAAGARDGIGLGATRSRLEMLYGSRQRLELRNTGEGEVEVTVLLPFRAKSREVELSHAVHSGSDR